MGGPTHTEGSVVATWALTHFLAFAISLGCTVLYFLIVLDNVPLSYTDANKSSIALKNPLWMVEVYVDKPDSSLQGLTDWGFGCMGYCGTTSTNRPGDESCVVRPGYQISGDVTSSALGANLGLPSAIRSSLSIAGILLIINTWQRLWFSFEFLLIFMLPSLHPAPAFSKVPDKMTDGMKPDWRTRRAYHLRGVWPLVELIITSVFAITAIGIAAAGTNQSEGLNHMSANLGKGTKFLITTLVAEWVAHGLIWVGGLRIDKGTYKFNEK